MIAKCDGPIPSCYKPVPNDPSPRDFATFNAKLKVNLKKNISHLLITVLDSKLKKNVMFTNVFKLLKDDN